MSTERSDGNLTLKSKSLYALRTVFQLSSAVVSAIAKGPLAGYSIGDRVDVDTSIWTLNNCTKREGSIKCSIFTFDIAPNRSRLPVARNAARKARTLHHPGVIKVIDTIETDTNIYIVTERVVPLTWHTRRKSLAEETIKWGLCGVARTLKFINEEASSIHGCVRGASIFVGDSGEWKIGGFDLLSSVKDEDAVIHTYSSLVPDLSRLMPPEVSKGNWDAIKTNPVHAVDSFDYGLLVAECFNGSPVQSGHAAQAPNIPSEMLQTYRRLFHANPKARLSTANFLDHGRRKGGFFQTPLINLTEGVDRLGLMSEWERDEFFSELQHASGDFPEDFAKRKVLPELIKSVEFGGGGPKVLAVVLEIGAKLSDEEYDAQLVPVLVRLFSRQDRVMRVCLLENMESMVDRLPAKAVNDKIFPNLVTGFTDQAPLLREQTVKSILIIISKLNDRAINGELLKYLAKTANDPEPGIRTNTTICLGKIARNMSTTTRSKVLIAAFTRSLRDPFVHARNASLLALGATTEMFTEEDCANRILPSICLSLIDKEKVVREQASKTLEQYLSRVRRYAQSLPETATTSNANGTATTGLRTSTPTSGTDFSWTGWAISSFTNKATAASGEMSSKPPLVAITGTRPKDTLQSIGSREFETGSQPPSNLSTGAAPKLTFPRTITETTKLAASFTTPGIIKDDWETSEWGAIDEADVSDDAWNSFNDEGNVKRLAKVSLDGSTAQLDSPVKSEAKSSEEATKQEPKKNQDSDNEPDFASWLKAQQSAKSGKPLPKGLGSAKAPGGSLPKNTKPTAAKTSTPRGISPQKAVQTPKPKEHVKKSDDDDWGDTWD